MVHRPIYVYICGPYASPDPVANTRQAVWMAEDLLGCGYTPYVPHLNHLWSLISEHDREYWLALDVAWLRKCDVLLRLPGVSPGADYEVSVALQLGIPIVFSIEDLRSLHNNHNDGGDAG